MSKQQEGNKEYKRYRVQTYISPTDKERLDAIIEKYGFVSTYQVLQYLVHCFLRVADPANDPITEPIPYEIEEMFTKNEEWERRTSSSRSHEGMNIKQKPDQRKYKTPDDLSNK